MEHGDTGLLERRARNLKKLARESRKLMEGAAALSSDCSREAGNLLSAGYPIRQLAPLFR